MFERLYVAVKFSNDGRAVCAFTVSSRSEFERWKGKDPHSIIEVYYKTNADDPLSYLFACSLD